MNHPGRKGEVQAVAVATLDEMRERIKRKSKLKGRQADDVSLAEVVALIGPRPEGGHRRDLLIEHLHKLNDAYRCLHVAHAILVSPKTKNTLLVYWMQCYQALPIRITPGAP